MWRIDCVDILLVQLDNLKKKTRSISIMEDICIEKTQLEPAVEDDATSNDLNQQ